MEEIWKDVKGYEGLYQISNLGSIKSLSRCKTSIDRYNNYYTYETRVKKLKPSINSKGYFNISLVKYCKKKSFSVHRLVAEAFLPNLENKTQVNHVNGIKTDNRLENLEWNTALENTRHAHRIGLCKKGITHHQSKQLICIKTGIIYESIRDASIKLKINNLGSKLLGKRKNNTTIIYLKEHD
jgi:hypothetical protein